MPRFTCVWLLEHSCCGQSNQHVMYHGKLQDTDCTSNTSCITNKIDSLSRISSHTSAPSCAPVLLLNIYISTSSPSTVSWPVMLSTLSIEPLSCASEWSPQTTVSVTWFFCPRPGNPGQALIDLINAVHLLVVRALKQSLTCYCSATVSLILNFWFLTLDTDDKPG